MRRRRLLPAALALALSAVPAGRRNGCPHGAGTPAVAEDRLSGAGGTAPAPGRPAPVPTGRNGERGAAPGRGSGSGAPRPGAGSGRGVTSDPGPGAGRGTGRERLRAWAELLRVSALFSVPGDALAGAAAVGRRPGRSTALAIAASLCLYEAGMALNDWADRDEDAVDRPHRPIPSGRISPAAALGAAGALTAAGLALAARAGRPALTVATGLAATVWAYDLHLKHTEAGPAAMAAARSLDLLLGATATVSAGTSAADTPRVPAAARVGVPGRGTRPDHVAGPARSTARAAPPPGVVAAVLPALPAALVLGAHTYGLTAVSRHEARGGSTGTPLAVLATTAALAAVVAGEWRGRSPDGRTVTSLPLTTAAPATATPGLGPGGMRHTSGTIAPRPARPRPTAPATADTPADAWQAPAAPGAAPARTARLRGLLGRPAASARLRDLVGPLPTRGACLLGLLGAAPARAAHLRDPLGRLAADPGRLVAVGLAGAYLRTAGPPLLHAALNPSPPLTQGAVGGGIRAMIPLQAALAARAGSPVTGLAVMGLVPLARSLARKVSPT
ncbi:SCO3242 family prenyltransferase [Streptomyces sp. NPDC087897]|uniref:SCO3242 family prenyltransferase n=1 Tax=Streptomyces sp. NPDC087897 TaxID=3365817 RepID=UPI0037FD6B06